MVVAATIIAVLVYRFAERRRTEETRTISLIQAEVGFPVEVEEVSLKPFQLVQRFTGTVIGGEEADAVALIGEYITDVLVTEGQYVEKNQVICKLSHDNPAASYNSLKHALKNSQTEFDRIDQLYQHGAVSKQAFDGVTLRLDLAKEAIEAAEKLLYVRAPINGRISKLNAETGKWTLPGTPLATIVSSGRLRVKFDLPAYDRALVDKGADCTVSAGNARVPGRLTRISLSADPENRSFTAWVDLKSQNSDYGFSPGLAVEIEVISVDESAVVTVHPFSLQREEANWFVYTVENNTATKKSVEIGARGSSMTWIAGGLSVGESVVSRGGNLLYTGAPVRIISSGQSEQ